MQRALKSHERPQSFFSLFTQPHMGRMCACAVLVSRTTQVIDLLRVQGEGLDNDDAASLLCIAATSGDVDQLRRLSDARVDVNATDYDGRSAMALAASEGKIECIEFLLSRFADINPVRFDLGFADSRRVCSPA